MGRKHYLLVTIALIISLMANIMTIAADDSSNNIIIDHTSHLSEMDGGLLVWGKIFIYNNGDGPLYVSSIEHILQAEHARWVTIKSEALLDPEDAAYVIPVGGSMAFPYSTFFVPEVNNDCYRHRVIVEAYHLEDEKVKFFADNILDLCECNMVGVPTSTPVATMAGEELQGNDGSCNDGQCPTETPQPEVSDSGVFEVQNVRGHITDIVTDISDGGYAVCVDVTMYEGTLDRSSLYILITTKNDNGWIKIFEDSMNIEAEGGINSTNTPLTFCFEGIRLTGDIEDYELCVQWKQGYFEDEGPIISRQCVNFHQIPAINLATYGVILATLAVIATVAVYIKRPK